MTREVPAPHGEFTLRLVSALALATIAIAATWVGAWPFLCLVILCILLVSREWAHMGPSSASARARARAEMVVIAVVAAAGAICVAAGQLAAAGAIIGAGILGCLMLGYGHGAAGLAYIGIPAAAVMALRTDAVYGLAAVVFLLLSVWCSDVMAYVVGRLVKGPKLAPAISPGKTWSGCIGGLVFCVALGYGFAMWLGGTSAAMLALVGGLLSLATQAGDLAESALKRSAGVKDAGNLIPGHGGLLDRLDGFLIAAAAAGVIALLRDPASPGRALLIWP